MADNKNTPTAEQLRKDVSEFLKNRYGDRVTFRRTRISPENRPEEGKGNIRRPKYNLT
jgi:hypothetical protein